LLDAKGLGMYGKLFFETIKVTVVIEKRMSALGKRPPTIYLDKDNQDVFDTLNETFMNTLPQGMVSDTKDNRLSAALVCLYSVAKQLVATNNRVYELSKRIETLENK
jgi:hypothetical protein